MTTTPIRRAVMFAAIPIATPHTPLAACLAMLFQHGKLHRQAEA
ncbi:MAG TPA: hypothetical protein VGF67_22510 [Ktedonobacteraceae bacterium]